MIRRWLIVSMAALSVGVATGSTEAQPQYPSKPVELVVGFAPGGGADVAGRLIAAYASKKWGTPVNVVNMPGASGITGALHVLRARPDGYTLMMDVHAVSSMLFAVQSDVPYKMDGKTSIALVTLDPVIYTVKQDSPWKSLQDVAAAAKANPKSFRYALGGIAGVASFSVSQFLYGAGVPVPETNRVVFTGGNPALTALAGGHVDFAGQQWSESAGLIGGKKIRGLAVVHPTRLPGLPDVPTAKEAGFPSLDVVGWQGLAGPPNLPAAIVQKWAALVEEASKDPAFLEQALKVSKVIAYKGPDAFWKFQEEELKKYLPLATQIGIRK
ncbi:MAG: tripartite tricarboxylate transporter substrate binding protein [Candidatus Rokubacteria bacterium]|nr:tripartite tricarboxylate transporter substrate binding protein [Candidatus Rokubacteria bacterium]